MLLEEHSFANTLRLKSYVGRDATLFNELVGCITDGEYRLCQRASWCLSKIIDDAPELLEPHIGALVMLLNDKQKHVAVRRNIIRVLQNTLIEPPYQEVAIDACFNLIMDFEEPIAVKAFAMTLLERNIRAYPELQAELKLILEEQLPHGSPGFKNRAKKTLALLKRNIMSKN